jgi:translation initiation factor IF-2
MRIYDLAKSISQQLGIDVKSSKLAEEFSTLAEFGEIHQSVKSHASSVDDRHASIMFSIYTKRHGADCAEEGAPPPETAADATAEAGPTVQVSSEADKRIPVKPVQVKRPVPTVPQNAPPRPAPIRPSGVRSLSPIPVAPRPVPIRPATTPGIPRDTGSAPAAYPVSGIGTAASVKPVLPGAVKPRPTGLATELKSSTGTTGLTAEPDQMARRTESGRSESAEMATGRPHAPALPKFSTDSPFVKPMPPKPESRAKSYQKKTTPPPKKDSPKESLDLSIDIALPEIGQMKQAKGKRFKGDKKHPGADSGERNKKKSGFRPSKVYGDAQEFRRPIKPLKKGDPVTEKIKEEAPIIPDGPVIITGPLTVSEFAEKIRCPAAEIIKNVFLKGNVLTINQLIDLDVAEEIAIEMDIDLILQLEHDESDIEEFRGVEDRVEDLVTRPPVVTIMGHVDHGKTTVLDHYRNSQVAGGEYGGITQHIGAYKVSTKHGDIVFLDTPGHEAFTAMRGRGVKATDIVVLVVSADDGVMPQTIEAINHAKAANVPMIIAINKMDLPGADPNRVRNELMQRGVIASQLGGDVEFVEISALKGTHMTDLLEVVSLQSEVLELQANPDRSAEAVIIESHTDSMRGTVATVLVQKGTFRIGDFFVVGRMVGRVRAMMDDHGRAKTEALPGEPVEMIGLDGTPEVGELLIVIEDERKAKQIAGRRDQRRRLMELGTTRHISLEGLHDRIAEGSIKELNVILKADVQGSIEAIIQSLEKLGNEEVQIRILHSGTGAVNDSDVQLANASDAIIIGFNVRPDAATADSAQREGVEIKLYRIIYELLEDLEQALTGMLDKQFAEKPQGRVEIREIFRVSRLGMIAGSYVLEGEVTRSANCRLVRDGVVVYEGRVGSLRRVKDDVPRVASGFECGVMLENFQDIKEGDIIESYTMEELPVALSRT